MATCIRVFGKYMRGNYGQLFKSWVRFAHACITSLNKLYIYTVDRVIFVLKIFPVKYFRGAKCLPTVYETFLRVRNYGKRDRL